MRGVLLGSGDANSDEDGWKVKLPLRAERLFISELEFVLLLLLPLFKSI